MNNLIQKCVKVLNFVTREEIYRILESEGKINKQLVDAKLMDLVNKDIILEVMPDENKLGLKGFMPGPNLEAEADTKVHRKIIDIEAERRDLTILNIKKISTRLEHKLSLQLNELIDNITGLYREPRKLELDYFGLTLKYHALRRFFYENFNYMPLEGLKESLNECRFLLDKLQIE
jgi:hypothetical protein